MLSGSNNMKNPTAMFNIVVIGLARPQVPGGLLVDADTRELKPPTPQCKRKLPNCNEEEDMGDQNFDGFDFGEEEDRKHKGIEREAMLENMSDLLDELYPSFLGGIGQKQPAANISRRRTVNALINRVMATDYLLTILQLTVNSFVTTDDIDTFIK